MERNVPLRSDLGLLLLRLACAFSFFIHGYPMLWGGQIQWESIGQSLSHIGIDFYPVELGFAAALGQTVGSVLLVLGIFFRPACIWLLVTMAAAALMHIKRGDGILTATHAIELMICMLSFLLLGPGKLVFFSLKNPGNRGK